MMSFKFFAQLRKNQHVLSKAFRTSGSQNYFLQFASPTSVSQLGPAITLRHFSIPAEPPNKQHTPWKYSKPNDWNNPIGNAVNKATLQARTNDEIWLQKSQEAKKQAARQPPPDAYAGRSIKVIGGNVADAYNRLESLLRRNRVRRAVKLTERHEKRGVKRRRLSSERWRRQFANEVRNKVQLVAQIRKRGA